MKPEDYDFPMAPCWRAYYDEQSASLVDFKCSADWRAYYASKGMMPADYPPEPPERPPSKPRAPQLPTKARAANVRRAKPAPRMEGVIRDRQRDLD